MQRHLIIFVEWFRFEGEQIGFKVQQVQTLSQVDLLFLVFWFLNFLLVRESPEFQSLEIFPPYFRHSCDEIISRFWLP